MHNNVSNFVSGIFIIFWPKKMFLFAFLDHRFRIEKSAVIFAAYDVWYGEHMRVSHVEARMFVEDVESANKHFRQIRQTEAFKMFLGPYMSNTLM